MKYIYLFLIIFSSYQLYHIYNKYDKKLLLKVHHGNIDYYKNFKEDFSIFINKRNEYQKFNINNIDITMFSLKNIDIVFSQDLSQMKIYEGIVKVTTKKKPQEIVLYDKEIIVEENATMIFVVKQNSIAIISNLKDNQIHSINNYNSFDINSLLRVDNKKIKIPVLKKNNITIEEVEVKI